MTHVTIVIMTHDTVVIMTHVTIVIMTHDTVVIMTHVTTVITQHMSLCHPTSRSVSPARSPAPPLPAPHLPQHTSCGRCPWTIHEQYGTQPITFHTKALLSLPQHFLLFTSCTIFFPIIVLLAQKCS